MIHALLQHSALASCWYSAVEAADSHDCRQCSKCISMRETD